MRSFSPILIVKGAAPPVMYENWFARCLESNQKPLHMLGILLGAPLGGLQASIWEKDFTNSIEKILT